MGRTNKLMGARRRCPERGLGAHRLNILVLRTFILEQLLDDLCGAGSCTYSYWIRSILYKYLILLAYSAVLLDGRPEIGYIAQIAR